MKRIGFFSVLFFFMFMTSAFGDCNTAQGIFNDAMSTQNMDTRINLLTKAAELCPGEFAIHFELARACESINQLKQAENALRDAHGSAGDNESVAMVLAFFGQIQEKKGDSHQAAIYYLQAEKSFHIPEVKERLKKINAENINTIVDSKAITRALSLEERGLGINDKGFGVKPSVNLRVNFQYNSADMNDQGRQQAAELGKALGGKSLLDKQFILIGHTDSKGSDQYNLSLSKKRAESVKQYLIRQYGVDPNRLVTTGKGEAELLFTPEQSDQDRALNRRVEVKVK